MFILADHHGQVCVCTYACQSWHSDSAHDLASASVYACLATRGPPRPGVRMYVRVSELAFRFSTRFGIGLSVCLSSVKPVGLSVSVLADHHGQLAFRFSTRFGIGLSVCLSSVKPVGLSVSVLADHHGQCMLVSVNRGFVSISTATTTARCAYVRTRVRVGIQIQHTIWHRPGMLVSVKRVCVRMYVRVSELAFRFSTRFGIGLSVCLSSVKPVGLSVSVLADHHGQLAFRFSTRFGIGLSVCLSSVKPVGLSVSVLADHHGQLAFRFSTRFGIGLSVCLSSVKPVGLSVSVLADHHGQSWHSDSAHDLASASVYACRPPSVLIKVVFIYPVVLYLDVSCKVCGRFLLGHVLQLSPCDAFFSRTLRR
ncbi:hypothetical protein J6590_032084 [Homalodisca vitripennis]|nr:hypothetical protein J6590_032084 [Homalodisca vitripennis]